MNQLQLFNLSVEEESLPVAYIPNFLTTAQADQLFADSKTLAWPGLTQLSQAMARLRRAERQTTRGQTWEHPDVLVAELNNLTIIYV